MPSIVANPYQVGGMIRDRKQFFGRERESVEILGRVATMQSVSVVGERRIGKSSLLSHLIDIGSTHLSAYGYTGHNSFYLDVQPIASAVEFYARACDLIDSQSQQGRASRLRGKDDLENAVSREKGRKVVLCLDEFEQAAEADFGSDFFKFLRHLVQSGDIAFIVATKSPLNELYRRDEELTSGFSNVFTTFKLGELAEGEARDLVGQPRNGHAFSSNDVEQILALAGRHPYWLNYVCAQAYDAKQAGRLDRKAFDAIEGRLNEERRMAEAMRTEEAEDARPVTAALETQTTGAPGVKDPNAPLRCILRRVVLARMLTAPPYAAGNTFLHSCRSSGQIAASFAER